VKNAINGIILIFLASCFSAPSVAADNKCSAAAQAIPLCSVVTDDTKYDGKQVTVKGLYRKTSHGEILMSPECNPSSANLREARDYKADKHVLAALHSLSKVKKGEPKPVAVVLRGTFRIAPQGQCLGRECLLYEIDQHELMCAEPAPPEPPKPTAAEGGDNSPK
jgi:hypothetical protein